MITAETLKDLDRATTAIAIVVGKDRFFTRFTKTGNVLTAWSLAGAQLFGAWQGNEIARTQARILKVTRRATRMQIVEVRP